VNVRAAIRRLFGIALTLIAVSVGMFWASASYARRAVAERNQHASPFAAFPVFFNPRPIGVRDISTDAVRAIARGGKEAVPARLALARLGGAALPYVLPALDSLDPRSRERVALALTPIAVRMEVATREELADGSQAVLFWTRFWQDRAIDFRTASVRHLTTRLAERSIALRREDLIHVDTFALPALIDALGQATKVETLDDVARVQRLNSVLAHITDLSVFCPPNASVDDARRVVETWQDFWELHGSEYVALDGPRRLAATFVETQYGKWVAAVLHGGLGRTRSGQHALDLVTQGLTTTSFLLFVGLGGGFPLGVVWTRFERRAHQPLTRLASAVAGTALAAVPCATFVHLLAGATAGLASAICIVTITTAAWVSRHLARSAMSQSVSPIAAAFSVSAPLGATYPPFVLSAIVLVELMFRLPGLGRTAALSLASGDVNAWMAASLSLASASLLLRHAADLLRPRGGADPSEIASAS
jgi:ABC-type dipeptide/oligopeptide/nickel transport system permease component